MKHSTNMIAYEIRRRLLAGTSDDDITRALSVQYDKDSIESAQIEVMEFFKRCAEQNPLVYLGFILESERHIYERSMESEDFKIALSSLEGMRKVLHDIAPYRNAE